MTRFELLQLVLVQARSHGFQYRRWYALFLGLPWEGAHKATEVLCERRLYYALLFSREFAESFWKGGEKMTLQVPKHTFERRMSDGTVGTVTRKPFTRRTTRPDAWRYHLREMSVAEDPLRYIRRFLRVTDDLEPDKANALSTPAATDPASSSTKKTSSPTKPPPASLPWSPGSG